MKNTLVFVALFGVLVGLAEMGVLPVESNWNDLDSLQRTRRSPPSGSCTPGDVWPDACNYCWCVSTGLGYACTKKACIQFSPEPTEGTDPKLNEDVKKVEEAKVCVPNETFKRDCNKCRCNEEGTSFSCTRIGCDGFAPGEFKQEENDGVEPSLDDDEGSARHVQFKDKCIIMLRNAHTSVKVALTSEKQFCNLISF